jgi:prolyl-tRNA editing enzyme YbaK/EbsC (Cys-tRNA(Pro) deacylase)
MDIEAIVRAAADATGIPYTVIPCDPELADTAAFCAHYGYPERQSANTIVVASKRPPGHNAACVVLATTRLDVNKKVRDLLDVKKLSFAPPELTAEITGMTMGGVTAFGLPDDLPLYVDDRILGLDWVILGGGSRSLKLQASPEILARLPNAEIVRDLAFE